MTVPLRVILPIYVVAIFSCPARTYLFIQDVIQLRSLAESAFATFDWTQFPTFLNESILFALDLQTLRALCIILFKGSWASRLDSRGRTSILPFQLILACVVVFRRLLYIIMNHMNIAW